MNNEAEDELGNKGWIFISIKSFVAAAYDRRHSMANWPPFSIGRIHRQPSRIPALFHHSARGCPALEELLWVRVLKIPQPQPGLSAFPERETLLRANSIADWRSDAPRADARAKLLQNCEVRLGPIRANG